MNKNKRRNMRCMAGAMAVVIAAGLAGNYGYQRSLITAKAAEVDTKELQEVAENALDRDGEAKESTAAGKEQGTSKEESVYVKTDPAGNVKNITVTEWLKNPGNGTLSDVSELEDIRNIKGDEICEASSESGLDWQAEGNDIYYQGTTGKALPVGVKISYKLDGREISAKDLRGKGGKVEIHIQYTNHSKVAVDVDGKSEEMFTPFTMITAMMLPTDEYQNVEIDNGKVISDADKEIVVGLGFPGLSENLKLENGDFELPEDVTITADVKNASVGPTITMASTEFLQDLDLDDIDDFDDLSDSIDELKDATNQLVDGSRSAADGAGELAKGAKTLADGTQSLDDGAGSLQTGLGTLQASIDHKKQGTNDQSGLLEGAASLKNGITSYTQGITEIKGAMDQNQMAEGAASLSLGAQDVSSGAQQIAGGLAGLKSQTAAAADTAALTSAIDVFSGSVSSITGTVTAQGSFPVNAAVTAGSVIDESALRAALSNAGFTEENIAVVLNALETSQGTVPVTVTADDINQAIGQGLLSVQVDQADIDNAKQAAATVLTEADKIAAAAATANGTAAALQGAIAGDGTNPGLVQGASDLATGAGQLSAGIAGIKQGVDELYRFNQGLNNGAGAIFAGMEQVSAGVGQLADGAGTLKSGTSQLNSGTGVLAEGADALAEGNQTLAEGMSEYKTEAIDKLTDLFDGDITKITDRLKAMTDLGKDYRSFAGIQSEMRGSTKFIIETEGVGE